MYFLFYACTPSTYPLQRGQSNFITEPSIEPNPVYDLTFSVSFQISLILIGLIALVYKVLLNFQVVYLPFNSNLNLINLKTINKERNISYCDYHFLHFLLFIIPATEMSYDVIITFFIFLYSGSDQNNYSFMILNICKCCSYLLPFMTYLCIAVRALSPISHILCFVLTLSMAYKIKRYPPLWVPLLLVLLSNDVELNPGDHYHDNFFTFMNWNLNSLAKNNFQRVQLIEAHNSVFNYDIISLCETGLNSEIEIPEPLLNDYTFIAANHPGNVCHGGVGLFYKNSLPLKLRPDLALNESIVVELKFGRKKIFFTVLYRTPSVHHSDSEFQNFIDNFDKLHHDILNEKPYGIFYTGDFNAHSEFWWTDGDTTPEGKK